MMAGACDIACSAHTRNNNKNAATSFKMCIVCTNILYILTSTDITLCASHQLAQPNHFPLSSPQKRVHKKEESFARQVLNKRYELLDLEQSMVFFARTKSASKNQTSLFVCASKNQKLLSLKMSGGLTSPKTPEKRSIFVVLPYVSVQTLPHDA